MTLRYDLPATHVVNEEPYVAVFDDFVTETERRALIAAGRDKLKTALVSGGKGGVESAGRSGRNCWIAHNNNAIVQALCERLSRLVGLGLDQAESLQLVHYAREQQYAPHFDAWNGDTERGQRCMARGGQRLVTCLFYLNDVDAGGGTGFPKLDLTVSARKGRLLVFYNCHKGTNERHPHSLHGGLPVAAGEKWACNLWFRERDYR